MLNIGDAVLTFLGDTTQLDQVFARLPAEAEASMGTVAASVGAVNFELDATGSNAAYAGGMIEEEMGKAAVGTELTGKALREAKGEAGLIGEMFQIHLPRHVRSFIAEIPGVGTALQAAFAATAVLFLIDALVKGIEKIQEWSEHSIKIAAAWEGYDQTVFESSTHMQKEIDKLEQKFIEMTQGPVAGLDFALKHLETTAFETFGLIVKDVEASVKAMNEASSSLIGIQFNVFKDAGKDLEKFKLQLEKLMREAQQSQPGDPFAPYKAAIEAVQQKERELTSLIKQRTAASGADASAAVDGLHAERQAVNQMLPLLEQGIRIQEDKDKILKQSRADDYATKEATDLKQALDLQIAGIDKWKAAQQAAYASGRINASAWKVAEVQAADAAAIAHETYLQKMIAAYTRSGQTLKAHTSQQELATLQTKNTAKETDALSSALEKHRLATQKVVEWYHDLINAHVDKDFSATAKATEQLTKAEEDLLKAQTRLAEADVTKTFRDQEQAIGRLAQFHLISEEQKAHRLEMLYRQEEKVALDILKDQLAKEKSVMDAAQARVVQAKSNPLNITDAQLLELKSNLAKVTVAYTNTQTEIVKTTDKFDKQLLALDKGRYGQALAMATASGKAILAEKLKENHATLLAAQANLVEAKARGANTKAIEQEIASLKKLEKKLGNEALRVKGVSSAMVEFKSTMVSAITEEVQAFATATEAMITGQQSFGQAMEAATFKMIGSMARQWADYYLAKGVGNLADMNYGAAAQDFAAAALFEVLGGVMSGLASNVSKSSGASGGTGPAMTTGSNTQPAKNPTQGPVNVPHLAAGALITSPTLAMLGEESRREAVLPLTDSNAMNMIAEAISKHLKTGGGETNFYIKGMVSSDTVGKMAKKLSRQVQTGRTRLTASNTHKITRRA